MSELPQTQEVGDVSTLDGNSQVISQIWGGLFPLKKNMPSLRMSKESYTVGREGSCDIVLTTEMFTHGTHLNVVSKIHFRISRESTNVSPQVFIYDLSTNGTFVNGKKIGKGHRQPLSNNDEISIATQNCKCFMFTDTLSSEYPPEVSSKYTICRSLGRGACGEVRVAYSRETCLQYAIKIVSKKTFSSLYRSRFGNRELTEVEILKKLNYPCIVKINEVIETEETLYIVLELVEGGELFDRILSRGHLQEDDTKFFFLQMVLATKYLHDNDITHRDLKPENILLSGNSNRCLIKVTDFGLSKIVNDNTMLRTFCGTPTYLAPEVLLTAGNGAYTSLIDVWSLGVILYVCLVGYPPFTDERKDCDLKTQITNGLYDFPEIYWRGVSEPAKDLVKRLMCVNPAERITLEETLLHPWLSDQTIRNQVADLMKTAGYPDLVDDVLHPHNLVSRVTNNGSTPEMLSTEVNDLNGTEGNQDVFGTFATRKRSAEGMDTEECQPDSKRFAF